MAVTFTLDKTSPIRFQGLSSDSKPTTYAAPGATKAVPVDSTFTETDTGDEFKFNGTTWNQSGESGSDYFYNAYLQAGEDQTNNVSVVEQGQFGYETVAVSQAAQVLGATGATGDFLHRLIIQVITVATASVTLLDNATSIVILTGGANLQEGVYSVEFNMVSSSGAWKITTGAGATVIGVGRFT